MIHKAFMRTLETSWKDTVLDKPKGKNIYMKMRKMSSISTISGPPPSWHRSQSGGEKPNLWLFPWEGKRRMEHSSNILTFHRPPWEVRFCLIWLWMVIGNQILRMTWSGQNKGALWFIVVQEHLQYCRQTSEGAKDYKLQRKQLADLSLHGKLHAYA